jgi:hypothetical protein
MEHFSTKNHHSSHKTVVLQTNNNTLTINQLPSKKCPQKHTKL